MAVRPVFVPHEAGPFLVRTQLVEFVWSAGMAVSQKQKSVRALHAAAAMLNIDNVLEVSSKSPHALGVALSAFNLSFTTKKSGRTLTVESAYQGSKVFENGGPFIDILTKPSIDAKRDERLRESGRLLKFCFFGDDWPLEPQTAFYDWVYLNALKTHEQLGSEIAGFSAFTDIEFNPGKSVNCQAYSVALYASLVRRRFLEKALSSKEAFLEIVSNFAVSSAREDLVTQPKLDFPRSP